MRSSSILLPLFLLLLSACSTSEEPTGINKEASLPATFNLSEMGLKVITSSIYPKNETMSTLYGNDIASAAFRNNNNSLPGEVIALVTWKQKEDVHWFGAKIPAALQSVEMIKTKAGQANTIEIIYECLEGSKLILRNDTAGDTNRIHYIFAQKPSVMP